MPVSPTSDPSAPLSDFSDIRHGGWLKRLPPGWRPYARLARLDRPIGWQLLLLPCWWSIVLAQPGQLHPVLLLLFLIGAIVMRGAGCTLNDIIDRDIDAAVERTRVRPIPSGEVSLFRAILFLTGQLLLGALVLFCLPWVTIYLGIAVLVLVATYPFMKRITFWPQFFLGLNFNWGALMGWMAVTGRLAPAPVLLYLAGIAWTLGYDTIYAHMDKQDDINAGVKSTALRFGDQSKHWVGGFYAGTVAAVSLALWISRAGLWSWVAIVLLTLHFLWQVVFWNLDDPANCLKRFKSNRDAGLLIFVACLLAGWA